MRASRPSTFFLLVLLFFALRPASGLSALVQHHLAIRAPRSGNRY